MFIDKVTLEESFYTLLFIIEYRKIIIILTDSMLQRPKRSKILLYNALTTVWTMILS